MTWCENLGSTDSSVKSISFGHHMTMFGIGYLPSWLVLGFSLYILTQCFAVACVTKAVTRDQPTVATIPGNITLGGLFSIFRPQKSRPCTALSTTDFLRLEAFFFAVDRINANKTFLPNTTLGVKAFDTCSSGKAALERAVKGFIPSLCSINDEVVVGVIGPISSEEAVFISPLLALFQIPIISYGASSIELRDKSKYGYFSSTFPPDSIQGKAIVDILRYFNWTFVSIVYSDEAYGRGGFNVIKKEANEHGICFGTEIKLPKNYSLVDYKNYFEELVSSGNPKVVVVFVVYYVLFSFMKDIQNFDKSAKLQYVGSETMGWLRNPGFGLNSTRGVIFTFPQTEPVEEFNEYFLDLSIDTNQRNPWFKRFFEKAGNCSFTKDAGALPRVRSTCNSHQSLRNINYDKKNFEMNLVPSVIDAVYAFAHSLDTLLKRRCMKHGQNTTICPTMREVSGKDLLDRIRSTTFRSMTGSTVSFDENGDIRGSYGIFNLEVDHDSYKYIRIGDYNLTFGSHNLTFVQNSSKSKFLDILSRCSEPCKAGQVKDRTQGKLCCWKCKTCPENAYVLNETNCHICDQGFKPDRKQRKCVRIKVSYFTTNDQMISLYIVLPPIIVSSLSILAVVFTAVVFIKSNNTPLVRASARELSYLLLVGLLLSFLFPFISIMKPSSFTCFLLFVLNDLPFTISLVAIAVKNNRTFRIFDPKRSLTSKPSFISPRAQMTMSFALISVQLLLMLIPLILSEFPHTKFLYPSAFEVNLICEMPQKENYLRQLYNFALLVVCTYYAYKTKNIPRNFNEAKYIAFAMYGCCVMFIAFFVVSQAAGGYSVAITPTIHCYRVTLTASSLLLCFFAPKLYIILLKPEENRRHSMAKGNSSPPPIEPDGIIESRPRNQNRYLVEDNSSSARVSAKMKEQQDKSIQTDQSGKMKEMQDKSIQTDQTELAD